MRGKIKVLFLAADPFSHKAPLELGVEMRAIDHAIRQGSAREALEFVCHFATQPGDLQAALLRHRPRVVHFAGHGSSGAIHLEDERGGRRKVGREALAELFRALDGGVRAVVLNGCNTLPVATELSTVVDYAIGTRDRIRDDTAVDFSRAFYTALAFGTDVPQAFALAVSQLRINRSDQADLPVLCERPDADPAPLLDVPIPEEDAGGGRVVQKGRYRDIEGERIDVIAEDHRGPGAPARSVEQDLHLSGVRSRGPVNIIGRRTGG
jgi:hypothetical protein